MDQPFRPDDYRDPDTLAHERAALFARTWLCLGWRDDPWPICVDPVRVEPWGGLLFAAADQDVPPLADWLGPYGPWLRAATARATRPDYRAHQPVGCNWKFLIENTLDDCHSATVHAKSLQSAFAAFRAADTTYHGAHSDITYRLSDDDAAFWQKATRRFGLTPFGAAPDYRHVFIFPNLYLAGFCETMVLVHRIDPVDPKNSLFHWTLTLPYTATSPLRTRQHQALVQDLTQKAARIIEEDRVICVKAQQGIEYAVHPPLFGPREARLSHFHQSLRGVFAL